MPQSLGVLPYDVQYSVNLHGKKIAGDCYSVVSLRVWPPRASSKKMDGDKEGVFKFFFTATCVDALATDVIPAACLHTCSFG